MQESSYQQLIERLAECEDLAKNAKEPSVRGKAADLADGYRDLIARADKLLNGQWRHVCHAAWPVVEQTGIRTPRTQPGLKQP
jgi:hypothetical protein